MVILFYISKLSEIVKINSGKHHIAKSCRKHYVQQGKKFIGCCDCFMIPHINPNKGNHIIEDKDDCKSITSIIISTMKEPFLLSYPCETDKINDCVDRSIFDAIVKDNNGVLQIVVVLVLL